MSVLIWAPSLARPGPAPSWDNCATPPTEIITRLHNERGSRRRQEEHFHNWHLTAIKCYSPPSSIFIHLQYSCFQVLVLIVSAAAEKYYVGPDRSFGAPFHYDFILEADWVIQSSSGLCWAPTQDLLRNARPRPGPRPRCDPQRQKLMKNCSGS